MWFVKSRRAKNVDDFETWLRGGVVPTLNVFDNSGDTRATVLIKTVAYSIREDAKANTFSSTETDTALAVQALQPSVQSHHAQIFLAEETMIRRLTPMECERLQGFPDGWTEGQADTHRYKQMGNAVAVPVVSWLVNRLMEVSNDMD